MLLYVTTSSEHMKTIVAASHGPYVLVRFILFDVTEYQMRCYPSNLALFGASCQSKESGDSSQLIALGYNTMHASIATMVFEIGISS